MTLSLALGLGVVLVDECKHLGAALGLNTLAGNDLEPTFGFRLLVRSMHIAAVQADRQGWSRWRLFRPIAGTTFNELELFLAQLTLDPFGNASQVAPYGRGADLFGDRQDFR